ncbi:tautomerase family protein [Halostreptopolyspora alba]|uniref:4-oxalocrotonate tautomerase-like domain-containing protein n=1 Tax=Halostreptopolyspora alba TaxID=2487137 RepID=A0A3N0EE48_9ACTN|nr:hypothetical protein EFW17_06360 [Nocardiopsaceae bacterium YIM 96095]
MPSLRVTIPHGDLSDEQRTALAVRLTDSISAFYREQKQEDVSSFVVAHIHETAPAGYTVGGQLIG